MKRLAALLAVGGVLVMLPLATSVPAVASTTVTVSMSFTEPVVHDFKSGCPVVPEGFCGSGQVLPFGHATETIQFGAACGGGCDLRTVNVAAGSIVMDEYFGTSFCPGACQPNRAEPGGGTLTDVIVSGTGTFADASGQLNGVVIAAGPANSVSLSGTITLSS